MRRVLIGLICIASSGAAQAQFDEAPPTWEREAIMAASECLNETGPSADRAPACRGIIYDACPENAGSTQDMVDCSAAEYRFWDQQLNLNYRALLQTYTAEDALEEESSPYRLAPLLREAQRAWITYRDANCQGFERNRFRGGTLGRLTAAACLSDMTAQRAQALAVLLEETRL